MTEKLLLLTAHSATQQLNWKWLGAIVISLVVIATTGELIDALTGCENYTQNMITDTLK